MIWVTGDTHGGIDFSKLERDECPDLYVDPKATLIICGDFGLPWPTLYPWRNRETDEANLRWLSSRPWLTCWVDGNHEDFGFWPTVPVEEAWGGRVQRLPDYPNIVHLMRGEVYDLPVAGPGSSTKRILAFGGARSVDRGLREEGSTWFPEEEPSEEDVRNAERNLDRVGWEVDYVVSHTCPTSVLPRALWPDTGWDTPLVDEASRALESIVSHLTFKRWYFGHLHRDRAIDRRYGELYDQVIQAGDLPEE